MKLKIILPALLIILFTQFVSAQNDCTKKFSVACFGSGQDEYGKVDAPESFYRGKRGLTINVTYNAFTPQAQTAFDYSVQIWQSILNGTVPIKVNVFFLPLGAGGLLGITFPNGVKNFPNAPVADVWYPTSLANQLAGVEQNVGESDFDMYINSSANWYYGTDGNCPIGKYDLCSIALHEMGHGFGIVGLSKIDSFNVGSFGLLTLNDFSPALISFPWPELDTLPGIFDHHLMTSDGTNITATFANPSDTLATIFKSNSVYWNGIFGLQYNNSVEPKIYAPATFALGSSMVHLDEATFPVGNPNELMTPFAASHSSNHNPGPVAIAILKDIGWNVDPTFNSADELQIADYRLQISPNPANDFITVNNLSHKQGEIILTDLAGRILLNENVSSDEMKIDVHDLSPGIYFVGLKNKESRSVVKMVKD